MTPVSEINKPMDDSDMKIVGAEEEAVPHEQTEQQWEQEKENGNIDRAKLLGKNLAEAFARRESGAANGVAENPAILCQRRILMAFTAESTLKSCLPADVTVDTAQAMFMNTLQEMAPSFYEDLQESGAFSFYYMCLRDGREVEKQIGKAFASLCGVAGSESYERMGQLLYVQCVEQIKQLAVGMGFKTEE